MQIMKMININNQQRDPGKYAIINLFKINVSNSHSQKQNTRNPLGMLAKLLFVFILDNYLNIP